MALRYKLTSGGVLADIPSYALAGTYAGGYEIVYPQAQALDGLGRPCAAVGGPDIVIRSEAMTGTGFQWWHWPFSNSLTTYAAFWIEVPNQRVTHTVQLWTGYLIRPTCTYTSQGSTAAKTIHHGVEIRIVGCTYVSG